MKIQDLQDAESYIYIRVISKIAGRFKEGDCINVFNLNHEGSTPVWCKEEECIDGFRSRIDHNKDFNVNFTPVHKITKCVDGYIETQIFNPLIGTKFEDKWFRIYDSYDVTGYRLKGHIEDFLCDLDVESDADAVVDFFVNGYIKLDEDFADSIIFESQYTPYINRSETKDMMDKIETAKKLEEKELLSRRARKGHVTRRFKKELALKQAKADARKAAALLKAQKAEVKRIGKVVNSKTKKKKK